MDSNQIFIWIIVGLVAGVLASFVAGNGFGLVGDIVVGILGAFIGGWGFREMHWHSPIAGLPGVILVAFLGACLLLLVLRALRMGARRGQ